jgi:hypothetical protein
MVRRDQTPNNTRPDNPPSYTLIVRGRDGRPIFERFADVAAYRARLASLQHSDGESVSIDEIIGLLNL